LTSGALNRIKQIYDAEIGSAEGDELELLVTLIELYEEKSFPIDKPDPISAIKFRMEQQWAAFRLGGQTPIFSI